MLSPPSPSEFGRNGVCDLAIAGVSTTLSCVLGKVTAGLRAITPQKGAGRAVSFDQFRDLGSRSQVNTAVRFASDRHQDRLMPGNSCNDSGLCVQTQWPLRGNEYKGQYNF